MNGRVYDPFLGRMISADPTVPGAGNGQAFNRYSYVLNNPLALADPSGFDPDDGHLLEGASGVLQIVAGGAELYGFYAAGADILLIGAGATVAGGFLVMGTTVFVVAGGTYLIVNGMGEVLSAATGQEWPGIAQALSSAVFGSPIPANLLETATSLRGALEHVPTAAGPIADAITQAENAAGVADGIGSTVGDLINGRDNRHSGGGGGSSGAGPVSSGNGHAWNPAAGTYGTGGPDVAADSVTDSSGEICGPKTRPCNGMPNPNTPPPPSPLPPPPTPCDELDCHGDGT